MELDQNAGNRSVRKDQMQFSFRVLRRLRFGDIDDIAVLVLDFHFCFFTVDYGLRRFHKLHRVSRVVAIAFRRLSVTRVLRRKFLRGRLLDFDIHLFVLDGFFYRYFQRFGHRISFHGRQRNGINTWRGFLITQDTVAVFIRQDDRFGLFLLKKERHFKRDPHKGFPFHRLHGNSDLSGGRRGVHEQRNVRFLIGKPQISVQRDIVLHGISSGRLEHRLRFNRGDGSTERQRADGDPEDRRRTQQQRYHGGQRFL